MYGVLQACDQQKVALILRVKAYVPAQALCDLGDIMPSVGVGKKPANVIKGHSVRILRAMQGRMEWLSPPDSSKGSPSSLPEELRVNFNSKYLFSCILFQEAKPTAASTLTPGAPNAVCSA